MTMASSTTKPTAMLSPISDRLSMLKPATYISANVPTSASGTVMLGMIVAERLRRNRKITVTTSAIVSMSVNCTSLTDARIVVVRSMMMSILTAGGMAACSCGRAALIRSAVSITLAPGCFMTDENDRALAVRPARELAPLRPIDRMADVADAHGRAVLVGDDGVVPWLRDEQLIVVVDREGACRAVDAAFRTVRRDVGDRCAQVFEADAHRGKLLGIDLDADRRLLLSEDVDLGDPGDLADVLDQDIFRIVIHRRDRQRVGMDGEDQDRRIGRIDLSVIGRRRKVLRQLAAGGIDRGLDVARGRIDVAVEVELHRDRADAEHAGRGHLRDAGNLRELPLERRRNR